MVLVAGCLPPDSPAVPPAKPAVGPDITALVHTWIVATHVLASRATLTEGEAVEMHGRTIEIRSDGYTAPWQGTCEDAGRTHRVRDIAAVVDEFKIPPASLKHLVNFGLDGALDEYRLTCNGTTRVPPLTIHVAGARAMTCFSGVCYLLKR